MRKYFVALVCALSLSACVRAGNFDLLPFRSSVVNSLRGHAIHDFDSKAYQGTSTVRENEVVMNKALNARKGEAVIKDKLYEKSTYLRTVFKPNKSGSLQNLVYPLPLDARKIYESDKWVKIDGVVYHLLATEIDDYYYLFDEDGNFYNHGGIDKNGVLQLMSDEILLYPSDIKMNVISQQIDEVSNVRNGYEVKYGGAELDRIWFDYFVYDGNADGHFERINFPNKPGLITINGKGLRVIRADKDNITYMILKNDD